MGVFWASSATNFSTLRAARARLRSPPPRLLAPPRRRARACAMRALLRGVLLRLRLRFRFGSARRRALLSRGVAARVPLLSPARGGLSLGGALLGGGVGPCGGGGESEGRKREEEEEEEEEGGSAATPAATASGPPAATASGPPRRRSSSNHPTTQPAPSSTRARPTRRGARNGVVGTLGACAISPSSAYGPRGRKGGRGRGARRPPKAGARGTSTKEAGVEPGFWEPLGRARLVHLVPMACRRRGRPTRQEGRRRQAAPPAPTQQGRNRGLGTLGACMISPSSAYVLLWAGAGGSKEGHHIWHTPVYMSTKKCGIYEQ